MLSASVISLVFIKVTNFTTSQRSKQSQGRRYFGANMFLTSKPSNAPISTPPLTWSRFASATTGMPMLLRDCDITAEYPVDVDDENINEHGLSPALPGEKTKISSALALFRMSRILAKTLEHLYSASASYSISLKKLHSLSDELDQWHEELPDHLRLRFCNDKPATNLVSDRSPLLVSALYFQMLFAADCLVPCILSYSKSDPPSSALPWLR